MHLRQQQQLRRLQLPWVNEIFLSLDITRLKGYLDSNFELISLYIF